jgi:competence protein ComEC
MILAGLVCMWLIGLALAEHTQQPPGVWLTVAGIGLVGSLLARRQPNTWRLFAIGLIAFGLGAARQSVTQRALTASDLTYYNDQGSVELSGVIVDLPDVRDKDIQLRVQIDSLHIGKTNQAVSGVALVLAPSLGSYAYGDRLTLYGDPLTPPTFDTFDYQAYLANSAVYTLIQLPSITVTAHDQASPLLAAMYRFKARAQLLIDSWLPSPESALLNGVLLGIRTELPANIRDAFDQTGTARILAIDGAKMAIVIGLLTTLFGRIKRRWLMVGLITGCIVAYTLFVGAQVSVVRAATMGVLAILALQLGRDYSGLSGLAFALWLQTVIAPSAINEAALWISASATLGLVIAGDPVKKAVDGWLEKRFTAPTVKRISELFVESIMVTLIVTVAAMPVILLTFGQFSWFGIVINILITPAQGLILVIGLPAVLLGSILAPLGQILSWLSALPLAYTLAMVRAAAQIPDVAMAATITPVAVGGSYAIMFGLWRWLDRPAGVRHQWLINIRDTFRTPTIALLGSGIAALLWLVALAHPDGQLHVWFLDVGGNAVLIESPGGAWVLVDGGQNPTRLLAALGDRLPFNQRNLDALIITQGKSSDIAALPTLLNRYTIHTVLSNGLSGNATMQTISATATAAGSSLLTIGAGYTLKTDDGLQLVVLNPSQAPDAKTKPEEAALVLRLSYHDVSFILMSDLAAFTESQMIRDQYVRGSVLQVPSHGSDATNPAIFLNAVMPQVAVIEVESGNRTAQPAATTLQRLGTIPVYRTDQRGTLAFITDGQRLSVSTER